MVCINSSVEIALLCDEAVYLIHDAWCCGLDLVDRHAVYRPLHSRDALLVMFGFGTPWSSGGSTNHKSSAAWRPDIFQSCWQYLGVNEPLRPGVGKMFQTMMPVQAQLLRRDSFFQLIGITGYN